MQPARVVPLPKKQQVIILDDQIRLLTRYQKMVERSGSEARICKTAKDIIAEAKSFNPDSIILLDYDLGTEEVGIDVAKKLGQMGLKNLYAEFPIRVPGDFLKGYRLERLLAS